MSQMFFTHMLDEIAQELAAAGFGSRERVLAYMSEETWMTSDEALEAGWIHEITSGVITRRMVEEHA